MLRQIVQNLAVVCLRVRKIGGEDDKVVSETDKGDGGLLKKEIQGMKIYVLDHLRSTH